MTDKNCWWIQTFTGRAFDLSSPQPEQVCTEDIAHALANCCRYAGHSRWHYSVAQHSLLVAEIVAATDPELALAALLHDAAEAYIGDWSSPLKALMRQGRESSTLFLTPTHAVPGPPIDLNPSTPRWSPWSPLDVEQAVERAIGKRFNVDLVTRNPVIKAADLIALATEKRDLFGPAPRDGWGDSTGFEMPEPLTRRILRVTPEVAELAFLDAFRWGYGRDVK